MSRRWCFAPLATLLITQPRRKRGRCADRRGVIETISRCEMLDLFLRLTGTQQSGWHRCSCDNMLTEASKDWLILERITQVASSPHWIISVWCISNERGVDFSLSSVYENGTITHHRFVPSLRLSEQKYLASSTYPYRRSLGTNRFISFGVL